MSMKKPYFPVQENGPAPLQIEVRRQVRFEEVDPLGIVWHGRYASYFEDARTALGDKYGVGYKNFYAHNVVAPVKIMHLDYHHPLMFQDEFTIKGILYWSDAARMNHEFEIKTRTDQLVATGYSVQLMQDINHNLLMIPPPFYLAFCRKWKAGKWH